jgi:hypothetical protein
VINTIHVSMHYGMSGIISLGQQIKKNEMGRACSRYGDRRGAHRILLGRPEGRRPLGRPRHRWEDNIKMDLQAVEQGHKLDSAGSG